MGILICIAVAKPSDLQLFHYHSCTAVEGQDVLELNLAMKLSAESETEDNLLYGTIRNNGVASRPGLLSIFLTLTALTAVSLLFLLLLPIRENQK